MGIEKIEHKGRQILYADLRGLKRLEQQLPILEELEALLKTTPTGVLILANYEGARVGQEYMARVKEVGAVYLPKIERQAVVGITGLKDILLRGYVAFTGSKNIRTFDNDVEAMDWLVSE